MNIQQFVDRPLLSITANMNNASIDLRKLTVSRPKSNGNGGEFSIMNIRPMEHFRQGQINYRR